MKIRNIQKTTLKLGYVLILLSLLTLNSSALLTVDARGDIIKASTTVSPNALLKCVAFSPYVLKYNPDANSHPPTSLIDNLLDIIIQQTEYNCIMTYGTEYPLDHTFPAAEARGLKVFEIIWLKPGEDNTDQIQKGIEAALAYPDTIVRVSCGSEVLTKAINLGLPDPMTTAESTISDCIDQVKAAGVTQPITSIETWWQWCSGSANCVVPWTNIASLVDWIGINVNPWWDGKFSDKCIPASDAADYILSRIQLVKNLYPANEVALTSYGWPAGPSGYRETNTIGQKCDEASQANQNLVVSETTTALTDADIQGVVFEAFREGWKIKEGKVGPFWGILAYRHQPVLITPPNLEQLPNRRPTFDWNDVTGESGYNLQISRNSTFTKLILDVITKNSTYTPGTDLPAQATLFWRVRTKIKSTYGGWSIKRSVVTANSPSIPILLSPTSGLKIKGFTPTLKWKSSSLPTGTSLDYYHIQLATDLAFSNLIFDENVVLTEFTPSTELLQGVKYYWRVRAYNTTGAYSSWSAKWNFKTSSKLFDNSAWWIKKAATLPEDTMTVYVNDVSWGKTHLLMFGHLNSSNGSYPEVGALYADGYLRLIPFDLQYGTSFILGPSHWDGNENYFHHVKISRVDIDTSAAKPTGPLKITLTSRDYSSAVWPSYHFDITHQIIFFDPKSTSTTMSVTQSYTAAADFGLSTTRQANHEGFKIAQFSSMYMDDVYHDSNGAYYVDPNEEEHPFWFKDTTCDNLIFNSPSGLSKFNPWVQLLHSDDFSWQGNTPNAIIRLADPDLAVQLVPQGYLACSADPNDDNVGLWLNDETAPVAFSAGQSFNQAYSLISQDDPLPALPGLLTPNNGEVVPSLRPIFDWSDRYGAIGYTIQISTSPTFGSFLVNTNTVDSKFTMSTNLPPGKTLYWRVRTRSLNGSSLWSNTFQFTTP